MKIFVFGIRGFPYVGGGAEMHPEQLYPRLVEQGYDVTILTRKYLFPVWKYVKFKKIPYINNRYLETLSHSILCTFYCLFKRPDVVHIHNMGACPLVFLLELFNIDVVLTIHSLNYLHKKWGWRGKLVLNICEFIGVHFSRNIITVSHEIATHLAFKYKHSAPITYIPNGVNEPEYVPPFTTLIKFKLEPRKYILAVGRIDPVKGLDKLIEAYKRIKNPDYKLVIAGGITHETKYTKALFLEKSDKIKMTGFICGKELAELYTNAGLFVAASSNEGFPLVLLEAMSYGLPILVSNILPHRELGLPSFRYFNQTSTEELRIKIETLMERGIEKEEMKKYTMLLRRKYNWEAIVKDTMTVYTWTE